MIETAVDAIIVIDAHGAIQSVNPAAVRPVRIPERRNERTECVDADAGPRPVGSRPDISTRFCDQARRRPWSRARGRDARRKDGSIFPAHLAVAEWRLAEVRFFTGIMRDISELKAREQHVRFLLGEINRGGPPHGRAIRRPPDGRIEQRVRREIRRTVPGARRQPGHAGEQRMARGGNSLPRVGSDRPVRRLRRRQVHDRRSGAETDVKLYSSDRHGAARTRDQRHQTWRAVERKRAMSTSSGRSTTGTFTCAAD